MSEFTQALTFSDVEPFVEANIKANIAPMLLGVPGIGKSSLVESLKRKFKTDVFTVACNQLADRSDLTGVRMTEDDKGNPQMSFFPHETLQRAIQYAHSHPDETPIIFLDEINRAPADVTSAVLSFITLRRVGTTDFPKNIRFVTAGNDKGNVTSLDAASITRFALYHVMPDLETFMNVNATLNPYIKDTLNKYPDNLMAQKLAVEEDDDADDDSYDLSEDYASEEGFDQQTVPRTISALSDTLNALGIDKSGSDAEQELLAKYIANSMHNGEVPLLKTLIVSQVGETSFMENLYQEIQEQFNRMVSGGMTTGNTASQQGIDLDAIAPEQHIINTISKSQNYADIDHAVTSLSEDEKCDLLVWLFANESVKEIDNNRAVKDTIEIISNDLTSIHQNNRRTLIKMMTTSIFNKESVKEFQRIDSPAYKEVASIIESFL